MKLLSPKHLLLLLTLVATTSIDSIAYDGRPQKRGVEKRYTSPEEIQRRQDSIKYSLSGPMRMMRDTNEHVASASSAIDIKPRGNTPEQLDSIMAIWRASNTKSYYETYFTENQEYSQQLSKERPTDNMDSIYIARLQALNYTTPVPLTYNHEVRTAIERFTKASYAPIFSYAYYYFPIIEEEFINAGVPIEIRTLAVVESALSPLAKSGKEAVGIWQFMPITGREYGLEINSMVDQRCNPRMASRAASQYLKRMYNLYGDWTLAIAAYNCGPGRVNRALSASGVSLEDAGRLFWDIYDKLPSETRSYVPLYMGATYAFAYHKEHGIKIDTPPMPLAVDTIMIDRPLHLEQVSSTIDVDLETLKMLNPEYIMSIIPATTKQYPLTLPMERVTEFYNMRDSIFAKDSLYLKEYVVHANIEKKKTEAPPATYHTVKKGETLGGIAKKYGRTVNQLMQWNGIKNANSLRIGQRLRVSSK